ncbi:hypothetical protein JK358_37305 [Nocardia sp. 2]|uniref:Uncharacterized protein n=1 Tax=Nocardia acididurans TaxID=2802282 RepID=A0ABS1MJ46_9NOCA|nr:hypothetical protein [Nocardia acididurans]MBL1080070.1 hypothetical protein [Nocardia acididurans]
MSGRTLSRGVSATTNLILAALLAAISIQPVGVVVTAFLGASLCMCATAILIDWMNTKLYTETLYTFQPKRSLKLWITGPVATVSLVVFAPAILLMIAVRHYRVPLDLPSQPGVLYGLEAQRLSNTCLSDAPADAALSFLAKGILLSADEESRSAALNSLDRRLSTGAVRRAVKSGSK